MILGLSREDTIRNLVSNELYSIYKGEALVGLGDKTGGSSKDGSNMTFKDMIQDVSSIAALIVARALKYTPVDTGDLRRSLYIKGIGSGVEIGYTKDYAIYVHEIGFYNHESPTRYKFLEDAAFEVALETGTTYSIAISYEPLAVYLNIPNKGVDIIDVKTREKLNRSHERKLEVWDDFVNFDRASASEEDIIYHDKMSEFFNHWRGTGYSDWNIVDEWQDRNRHK